MAQGKDPDSTKPTKTNSGPEQQPDAPAAPVGAIATPEVGAVAAAEDAIDAVTIPTGGITLGVGEDIAKQLKDGSPAFGNVLSAIGDAIAASQAEFDKAVIDTVNELNKTNIDVVTQAIVELDDDGLPSADPAKTKLTTQSLSVLNFFTPVFHEWKNVSISMDLTVGEFHGEQGLSFKAHQQSSSASGSVSWPFAGWFRADTASSDQAVNTSAEQNAAWSSGQCRVDALLGPRSTGKFPVAASFSVGPQIFISQGAVTEQTSGGNTVTGRTTELLIELRKVDGSVNPGRTIVAEAPGLLAAPVAGTTTTSDTAGKVKLALTRNLAGGGAFRNFPVTIRLGQIDKTATVTL